jgi:uncharacterized protein (AIM24 family)
MMFMEDGIQMQTGNGGGIFKGFKRMLTGEGFFITTFYNTAPIKRHVSFGAPYRARSSLSTWQPLAAHLSVRKIHSFVQQMALTSTSLYQRIGAGLFGGEGFILQRLSGSGLAFVHAGGTIIRRELAPTKHSGWTPAVSCNGAFGKL